MTRDGPGRQAERFVFSAGADFGGGDTASATVLEAVGVGAVQRFWLRRGERRGDESVRECLRLLFTDAEKATRRNFVHERSKRASASTDL